MSDTEIERLGTAIAGLINKSIAVTALNPRTYLAGQLGAGSVDDLISTGWCNSKQPSGAISRYWDQETFEVACKLRVERIVFMTDQLLAELSQAQETPTP